MKFAALVLLLLFIVVPAAHTPVQAFSPAAQVVPGGDLDINQLLNNLTYTALAGIVAFMVWRRYVTEQDKAREHLEKEIDWLRAMQSSHVPLALPPGDDFRGEHG